MVLAITKETMAKWSWYCTLISVLLTILFLNSIILLFHLHSARGTSNAALAMLAEAGESGMPQIHVRGPQKTVKDPQVVQDVDLGEAEKYVSYEEYEKLAVLAEFSKIMDRVPNPLVLSPMESYTPQEQASGVAPRRSRLIFTLSTGHTGTMWLVRVLRCSAQNIIAEHEPKPSLISFHHVLRFGLEKTYALRYEEKLYTLLEAIDNATAVAGGGTYVESSHMFIKSWWDIMMDWIDEVDPENQVYDIDFVILRRNLPSVVRSLLTDPMSWDPAFQLKTWSGGEYTIHHRKMAMLPPLLPHGAEDSVDEILGYITDMELQFAAFQLRYPRYRYHQVRGEEIFSESGARRLITKLGLGPVNEHCIEVLKHATAVNQHVSWKGPELSEVPDEVFIARALEYRRRYEEAGLPFPALPQLRKVKPCGESEDPGLPWCEEPEPEFTSVQLMKLIKTKIPKNKPPIITPVPFYKSPAPTPRH